MILYDFFHIIIIGIICFIPVVLWGYFFSFSDNSQNNKKRFFLWVIAGGMSTIPILRLDRFYEFQVLSGLNVFDNISNFSLFWNYLLAFVSYIFLTLLLAWTLYCLGAIFFMKKTSTSSIIKSIIWATGVIWMILIAFAIIEVFSMVFPFLTKVYEEEPIMFWSALFDSLKLIIFYYVTIGFLEELAKHFSFVSWYIWRDITIKTGVLFSLFIALWFSFLENILYGIRVFEEYWLWKELVSVIFYRSIFSVFIHVFASSILWYYFTKAYLLQKAWAKITKYYSTLFLWMTWAICIHALFDIFLTYNMNFLIGVYFIIAYFTVSKIVFFNNNEWKKLI